MVQISSNISLQIREIIEKKEKELFLFFYTKSFSERCPCWLQGTYAKNTLLLGRIYIESMFIIKVLSTKMSSDCGCEWLADCSVTTRHIRNRDMVLGIA